MPLGLLAAHVAPAAEQASDAPRDATLARVEAGLAAREYEASLSRDRLQAPNRAQDLRTYFEPGRIRVHGRTDPKGRELVSLSLSALGRPSALGTAPPGSLSSDGARVEIRREGLVEWFLNTAAGLEHGFTLVARPPGDGPLVLELAVSGAQALPAGDAVAFASQAGRRLHYGGLAAFAADGAPLPARFEVRDPARVRLVVEDQGATYPLTIDPILTQTRISQLESDQVGAQLSFVAGAGDVNGDGYDDVIVGAPRYDAGQVDEGAAFLFLGSPGGIVVEGNPTTAAARLESDQAGAFSAAVAGAGDVNGDGYDDVIVGFAGYDAGQSNEGAAFVFLGSPSGIPDGNPSTASAWLESDQVGAGLGAVAGAGDVNGDGYDDVIVGAGGYNAGEAVEGAAFVFLGGPMGIANGSPATAAARLESDQVNAGLGPVAGAGDVNGDGYDDVIVGATGYDAGQAEEGAAFVFLGGPAGIADGNPATAAARLESDQGSGIVQFGATVAAAGDVNGDGYDDVIVGASYYDAGQPNEGAAFLFLGGPAGIADGSPATAAARIESNQASAHLGQAAGAGDVNGDGYGDVIVGAINYDAGQSDEGAAFVFLGGPAGLPDGDPTTAATRIEVDVTAAQLENVAGAGDVNGDGYDDVVVGASRYSAPQQLEGSAFVFLGGPSGIADHGGTGIAPTIVSDQGGEARLGASVSGAGDVNGDGFADLVVGAPRYDAGQTDEGAAFVFLGSSTGIANGNPATASARLESDQANAQLGSVAGAGDVDGDGYGDVIVGAFLYDAGQTDEGAAFVFLGSSTGIANGNPATASARLESDQASSHLGPVATAGDVNGDGYDDVVAGASSGGLSLDGRALVFLGSATGVATGGPDTAAADVEPNHAFAALGASVAGAGDVDGDGFDEVIAGAPGYVGAGDLAFMGWGAAFLFSVPEDADGDGFFDLGDNCTSVSNPDQLDADGDGCGNACDCDFNQNGICGEMDLAAFRSCFGGRPPAAGPLDDPSCSESDLNGDGVVGGTDFNVLRTWLGGSPGPGRTGP
jgi:hypothetical protein